MAWTVISGQVIGLVASVAAYLVGVKVFLHVQARTIEALPVEWREHPELRDRYQAALDQRLSVFTAPNRAGLAWLVGFTVLAAVLAGAKFTVSFEATYSAVLALWWTAAEYQRNAAESERIRKTYGLPAPPPRRGRRVGRWAARFVVWVGFLGTACCIGGLLAAALS